MGHGSGVGLEAKEDNLERFSFLFVFLKFI